MEGPPARSAHEAYRRFFEAFNSRSPDAWAGTLHFPHVRVAPKGPIRVIDTMAEHIAGMSWDAVDATGWDHTVEVEPEIVHSGPSRVHIAGGWTRFTKANLPVGLQLLSPAFDEDRMFRIARMYEAATDWHTKRPVV